MMLRVVLLAICAVVSVTSVPLKDSSISSRDEYLLPNTSVPHHYDLHLEVHLENKFMYNGTVKINVTVLKDNIKELVLHSVNLKIDVKRSFVVNSEGKKIKLNSIAENSKNQFLIVKLSEKINSGEYTLQIAFTGNYYSYARGLFLSQYKDKNENTKYLLATQFEPTHARDMFPCYDEPNLKTTFKVKVTHPRHLHAVSNMPVESVGSNSETKTTTFQTSPKMSTYLLAVSVSDFKVVEGQHHGKNIRIFVQPGEKENVKIALNLTLESVRKLETLLQVNYTLPKLDSIAVPTFGGGMENWGLIVYSPTIILPTNESISSGAYRSIVGLIAHETAHQWFGNLVTLDWWDYVWLNEGFATYYGTRISDLIFPKGRSMDYLLLENLQLLSTESNPKNAEAINRPVVVPNEIQGKFNGISYKKGGAIVRFMQMTFGGYDESISDYLKQNSYNNTKPLHLFTNVNERAKLRGNLTVQSIMRGWASNPGYPLLTVNVTRKGDITKISVSQERFSIEKVNTTDKWWIPITIATEENPDFNNLTVCDWLSDQSEKSELEVERVEGWVIVNLQKSAYMRVNYDHSNWKRIIKYLKGPKFTNIHHLNRIQLIDDSKKLAEANLLPKSISLSLLSYLKQEKDEVVLDAAKKMLREYKEFLRNTDTFENYKSFVKDILAENDAKDVLGELDLETQVKEAMTNYNLRHMTVSSSFQDLVDSLYTEEVFDKTQNIVKKNRSLINLDEELEFLEDIERRFHENIKAKKRFMENSYEEMRNWLNSKYQK